MFTIILWHSGTALSKAIKKISNETLVIAKYCAQCIPRESKPSLSKPDELIKAT